MTTKNYLKAVAFTVIFATGIFTMVSWKNKTTSDSKQLASVTNLNDKNHNVVDFADIIINDNYISGKNSKCGAGKCGDDKKAAAKKDGKCGSGKCGDDKKAAAKKN